MKMVSRMSRMSRVGARRIPKSRVARRVTVKKVASVAKRVVKNLAEKKYFDLNIDHAPSTTGALFPLMGNIVKGTDQDERIGDKITLRSFYFKQTVLMASAVGETKFRALIVRAKGALTTVATTDILKGHTSGLRVHSAVDTDKYEILYDRVFPLITEQKFRNVDIKLRINKNMYYNDSVAAPARDIYFLTISDAVVNTPAVQGNLRIHYIDL